MGLRTMRKTSIILYIYFFLIFVFGKYINTLVIHLPRVCNITTVWV